MVILLFILFGYIGCSYLVQCASGRSNAGKDKYFKLRRKQQQEQSESEQFYFVRSTPQPIIEHSTVIEELEEKEKEREEMIENTNPPPSPEYCSTQTENSITECLTAIEHESENEEELYTAICEQVIPKKIERARRMTVPELIHHFETLEI